ncbi:hypothetical protein L210DRAFT_210635 [Boletus edulis BED1]|uniref:Uncharacterized protein n=1 Tax=Boletus edulis BED1 TaxID=1328754 RepID=A0AAD4GB82_BOLED|nr:hypothetical protein L210DRAFT_210635 [Boletus edulis BED1]
MMAVILVPNTLSSVIASQYLPLAFALKHLYYHNGVSLNGSTWGYQNTFIAAAFAGLTTALTVRRITQAFGDVYKRRH